MCTHAIWDKNSTHVILLKYIIGYKYEKLIQGIFCPDILNFRVTLTAFYRLHHAVSCCPASCSSSINFLKCKMNYVGLGRGGASALNALIILK